MAYLNKPESWVHHPLQLSAGNKTLLIQDMDEKHPDFLNCLKAITGEKRAELSFYSSQPSFVQDRIHDICNSFIRDIAGKVDPIIREIIKNAEKENSTLLCKKLGIIARDKESAPLPLTKSLLNEKLFHEESIMPALYSDPDICVTLKFFEADNEFHIEIINSGNITEGKHKMVEKRIALGIELARFDLSQEFMPVTYSQCKDKIRGYFLAEYDENRLNKLWASCFDEDFDTYWKSVAYFKLIESKVHTSFYPYFTTAFCQIMAAVKKEENPDETYFSAGMGYIQCSFVLEANRSLYGTYGKLKSPFNRGNNTVAGFSIGLSSININIA